MTTAMFTMLKVIQAEAMVAVNQWNVRRVEDDISRAEEPPSPRAAHAGCAIGRRVMYFGGSNAKTERGDLLVLDLEQPDEERRR